MSDDQSRRTVLLVDDEQAITDALAPCLRRCGFVVHVAPDGERALLVHDRVRPDIVVSDVLMPRMDGRELVRRIRARGGWTPIILLTQIDVSHECSAALDEGATTTCRSPSTRRSSSPASGPSCAGPRAPPDRCRPPTG